MAKLVGAKAKAEPKDATLSVRVSATVRAALEKAAVADDRTVSAMAARLIERGLKEVGFLK